MPPTLSPLEQMAPQQEAEHTASLPVGIPEALGKQQQGAGLVAELSRTPSMSCPESAHVESQQ